MPSSYAIGSHFENFIRQQIESGRYSSASEVVRDALRLLEEHEELREAQIKNLRQQLQESGRSGPGIPADRVLDRLEEKISQAHKRTMIRPMHCVFSPLAELDLEEIGDYIGRGNASRAVSFIREIREQCAKIAAMPLAAPLRHELKVSA